MCPGSDGNFRNFRIQLFTAPGGVATRTYNLRKNGVTQLTTTITGADTVGLAAGPAHFVAGIDGI